MKNTYFFACSVAPLNDSRMFGRVYEMLSDERKKKVDGYRFQADKCLSAGAGILLKYALSEAGYSDIPLKFRYSEHGKPYLINGEIFFNISHSGEYAVCAVSQNETGCDIEKIETVDLKIAKRYFTRDEYDDIASQKTDEKKRQRFFRYWTLKESFMKASGLGMSLPLNAFEMVLSDEISVIQTADNRRFYFNEYDCIKGFGCALCETEKSEKPELEIIDLMTVLTK